jgi:hypothetical protein
MFSLGAGDLISAANAQQHRFDQKDDPRQPMKLMNDFFRALLYYSAMLRHNKDTPRTVTMSMVVPSLDRLLAVDTSQFGPLIRDFAEALQMMASSIFKQ